MDLINKISDGSKLYQFERMEFNKTMGGNKIKKIGVFCKPKAPSAIDILGETHPLVTQTELSCFFGYGYRSYHQ